MRRTTRKPFACSTNLSLEGLEDRSVPSGFTPGDLVVYRVGTGSAALSPASTAVFLDEYTTGGALVQSIALPTSANGSNQPLTSSGTATSEGMINLSTDGKYLMLTGYATGPGFATISGTSTTTSPGPVLRVIGRVDSAGAIDTSTTTTSFSGNSIRSAGSTNGTSIWAVGGSSGLVYTTLGATSGTVVSTSATSLRDVTPIGGQLYVSAASGSLRLGTVSGGTPTTGGQTITNLPGFPTTTGSPYQFVFADLSPSVAGVDTLYVADENSVTTGGGGIQKYSLVGGSWVSSGTITAAGSVRGLTASVIGSTVSLFAVSTTSTIYSVIDSTGYNASAAGLAATSVATAATNTAFRGIAFVPQAAVASATVQSITRETPVGATTNAGSVTWRVTFSSAVTGLTKDNFSLTLNGVSGASVTSATASTGNSWLVTAGTGSGDGTIQLNVENATGTSPTVTGLPTNITTATYTTDKTAPTYTVTGPSVSLTAGGPVTYTVTYTGADAVTLGAGDVTLIKTGTANATVAVGGTGTTTRTVTLSGITGDGSLGIRLAANTAADNAGNKAAASADSDTFTVDNTAPTVQSITRRTTNPTNASQVEFNVTFSESVTGVTTATFAATATGLPAAAVTDVSGSGSTYIVTVTTGPGEGTIGLDAVADTAVKDGVGYDFATPFTSGESFTIDRTPPRVSDVVRTGSAEFTTATSVQFTVTFNEDVTGVTENSFTPVVNGTFTNVTVTGYTRVDDRTYVVTVDAASGEGAITLDVPAAVATTDLAGNSQAESFAGSQSYTIDRTQPTVTVGSPDHTLTAGGPVSVTFTYADANPFTLGVTAGQVVLARTGNADATVGVSVGATTVTVTLTSITGDGTLTVALPAGVATDSAGNLSANTSASAAVTVDNTAPQVATVALGGTNPTNLASVTFTVTFDEDVTPPGTGNFTVATGGGVSAATVTGVTQVDTKTYTVSVSTGTGDGTLRLVVKAGVADLAGNPLAADYTTGPAYTVLKTPPAPTVTTPAADSVVGPAGYTGLAGTAADALGGQVASVTVTVKDTTTGLFWNGTTWAATGSIPAAVTGTGWTAAFPAAAQSTGTTYAVVASATDGAGNAGSSAAISYRWDAAAPAATVDLHGPFGPNDWPGAIGGTVADVGPAGVTTVRVVVTRSSDTNTFDVATQTWVSGTVTNLVTPSGGGWSLALPVSQLDDAVTYTVTAVGVDAAGNAQSPAASATFDFDAATPTSAVTAPPGTTGPNEWPASGQVRGTVSDTGAAGVGGVTVQIRRGSDGYFWSGSAWLPAATDLTASVASGSWSYTLPASALADGVSYTVASTATDAVGNVQATPGGGSFTWDAVAPEVTIDAIGNGTFAGPIGFTGFSGTATDGGSGVTGVAVTLTDTTTNTVVAAGAATLTGSNWAFAFDPAGLVNGHHYTLAAVATDAVGNSSAGTTAGFTFDSAGPNVTVTTPASTATAWNGFAGTADDPSGVQQVEYRVLTAGGLVWNGSAFAATGSWFTASGTTAWSGPFAFANFPADGTYRVEARGVDVLGNTGPVAAKDFTVALPTVTGIALRTPATSPTNTTGPVTWRVTFSDPVAGLTAANFALAGSFAGSAAVGTVTPVGSAPTTTWDVTASAPPTGTGTLGLNFVSSAGLTPNVSTASAVGAVYTLDRVAPAVVISNDAGATTIRAGQAVHYTVAFADDTAVGSAALTAGDVANAVASGAAAFSVANFVSTGAATFEFDVTPTGSGSFQLRLTAPVVTDTAGNQLTGPLTDAAVLTIDVTPPTVLSVVRTGSSPTNAAGAAYAVTFSEPVTGVDLSDFSLSAAGLSGASVTGLSGTGAVYTVTVSTGSGDGTLRLDVLNDGTVADLAGNPLAGGFTTAAGYAVDKTTPTATVALDATQQAVTNTQPIRFVVTFSEPVSGFGGVTLGGTANAAGASVQVTNPGGDGKTYLVAVSGLSGDGTLTVTVPAGAASDAAGNSLTTAVTSSAVTLDTTAPFVTAITRTSASPTNQSAVSFTVTFSEPVTGLDAGDFGLVTAGLTGSSITGVSGGGDTWTVDVSTGSGDGSLQLTLAPGATATDAAGNPLAAGGFGGEVYAVDRTGPVVTLTAPTPAVRTTPVGSVAVTFDAAVSGLTVGAFTLTRDDNPVDLSTATLGGGPGAYTLGNLAGLTNRDGVYVLTVNPTAAVTDVAGNPLTVGASVTFTVDVTAPTVQITPAVAGPTNAATVAFTVRFSEAVTGVTAGRFAVAGTAPGTAVVSVSTVSAGVYTVVVDTGAGSGTVGLTLLPTTAITDPAGNAVAGLPAASGFVAVDHAAPAVAIADGDADGVIAVNVPVVYTVDVTDAGGVTGTLTAADFTNAGTAGAVIGNVSATVIGGGLRFTVPVTPTTGGTVVLRLATAGTLADAAGNAPLLPAQAGRALTVDAAAPTVTVALAGGQPAVTNAQPVQFAVTFSEPVVGFGPGKVSLTGPGAAGATVRVSGSGPVYFVSVSGLTEGTYSLSVPAGGVADVAGNPSAGSAGAASVVLDLTPPAAGTPALDPASDTGAADGITRVTTPTISGTAEVGATVRLYEGATLLGTATATGGTWNITTGTLAEGPHTVFARATDAAGNAADSAAVTVTIDTTGPAVTVTRAAGQGAAVLGGPGGTTVTFAVTTSEPAGGLDPAAVSVTGTAGGTVAGVTGSGSAYLVTVSGLTRPGTVGLAVATGAGSDAAGNLSRAAAAGGTVDVRYQPAVQLVVSPADLRQGDAVNLTALVSSPAAVAVTGTVTFTAVGPTTTVTVVAPVTGGSAGATIPNLAGGDWTVTAALAGTGGFLDASAAGSFAVRPAVPSGQNTVDRYAAPAGNGVTVYAADGSVVSTATPFTAAEAPGGVRVAVADVTGDTVPDLIAGTAPGAAAAVRVIDGATGRTLYSWSVFEGFTGGVYVAAGDLTGDGKAEVVVTPDQGGGPRVLVFDGASGRQVASFLGITDPNFRGGARAAVGDLNRDGTADVLVSAGFGGGPRVAGFDGRTVGAGQPAKLFNDFFLFEPALRNGAFVTLGDVDGDGYADVIGGGGPGGAPRVFALSGHDLVTAGAFTPLANFFAGPTDLRGGVRVTAKDLDGDGLADLVTGSGDTGTLNVYTNAALRSADPQPSGGFDMIENLLDGVQVG